MIIFNIIILIQSVFEDIKIELKITIIPKMKVLIFMIYKIQDSKTSLFNNIF